VLIVIISSGLVSYLLVRYLTSLIARLRAAPQKPGWGESSLTTAWADST
jgi:hypothetical protein